MDHQHWPDYHNQLTQVYIETWEKFTNGQLSADMVLVLKITINIYKSNLNSFQDSKLLIFVRKKRWVKISDPPPLEQLSP